jgi:extracellular factor (EF) 3-hydroxypalmitic acid methyl ester biosynthesis protein
MNQLSQGQKDGKRHGDTPMAQAKKTASRLPPPAAAPEKKESEVRFKTTDGTALRGTPVRVTRHTIVFELYSPSSLPRFSEALTDFKVNLQDRPLYSGRAVVRNVVDAGAVVTCEVKLTESDWVPLALTIAQAFTHGNLVREFQSFLAEWQKSYKILPEFKVAIADLQMILMELRLWLDKVQLEIDSQPKEIRGQIERVLISDLRDLILAAVGHLLEKFELVAEKVGPEHRPAHIAYMQHQIHPFVLTAPFIHRTFTKPLGYAGDYEMVSMMVRDPYEGNSLFAKILNYIFLQTPPVEAHRNRLTYLTQMLRDETVRARGSRKGNRVRIFNLGCGPAKEIQDFVTHHHVAEHAHFLLLDFNEETLASTSHVLEGLVLEHERATKIDTMKKSVQQILKEGSKLESSFEKFDIVYCAGLFDYLSDNVCEKLLEFFYHITAPGGLVVATNVADINPSRGWMEYMLDWHLIYRSVQGFRDVVPKNIDPEQAIVRAVGTGVNIVVEIRKPHD